MRAVLWAFDWVVWGLACSAAVAMRCARLKRQKDMSAEIGASGSLTQMQSVTKAGGGVTVLIGGWQRLIAPIADGRFDLQQHKIHTNVYFFHRLCLVRFLA